MNQSRLYNLSKLQELPFRVPFRYFDELPARTLLKLKGAEAPALPPAAESAGLAVPEGYFNSLEGRLKARIQQEKAAKASIDSAPFTVPEGFFEQQEQQILSRIKPAAKEAPVRQLWPQTRSLWLGWAAAAAAVLGIGLGIVKFALPSQQQPAVASAIESMDRQVVAQYLLTEANIHPADLTEVVSQSQHREEIITAVQEAALPASKNLDKAIEEYLDETYASPDLP